MTERTFDRVPSRDPRNHNYPIRALGPPARRRKVWSPGEILNQGPDGACTGFAFAAELAATPVRIPDIGYDAAWRIYKNAQDIDEWEGNNYQGSSVLAAAKVCQRQGFIKEYRWGRTATDLVIGLQRGPCVLGVDWPDTAFETGPGGFLDVTGRSVGGHAILCYGYNPALKVDGQPVEVFALVQSWGPEWGVAGRCLVRADHMDQWLSRDGEICLPTMRSYHRTETP